MSRTEELVGTLIVCGICLLVIAFLSDGNAMVALMYFGLPLAFFIVISSATGQGIAPGWLVGTTSAFIAVAIFEAVWETYLYKGPNSMPGFVYIFMCVPLSLIALAPARIVTIRMPGAPVFVRAMVSFGTVFIIGSAVILWSLASAR